jgi:hypothetical protein
MKLSIQAGSTSQTVNIFIQDSSSTTGAGLTGLVFNSAGLTAYYGLSRAAAAAITLATQTVTGAWSSGGFVEISSANMPGWYRFDIPDAALASGRFVSLHLKGATNMAPLPVEIELTAINNQSATAFMTSVASVVGAVGSVTGAVGSVTGNVGGNVTGTVGSVVGAVGSVTGNVGGNVTGSVGSVVGAVGSVAGNVGGNVVGSVASVTGAVASVTGNVGGSVASVTAPVSITAGQLFIKKNTQIVVTFPMTDSTTHAPATGLTVTAQRSIDGAAVGSCANSVTELTGGLYKITLAAGDVNGAMITLILTAAAADTRFLGIVTQA